MIETVLTWLIVLIVLAGLGVGGAYLYRTYVSGSGGGLFGPPRERRLDVVDSASVDGRRRLVLVRRDDVEHLIMTGGPVDVVIETGIGQRRARIAPVEPQEPERPVYTRAPRAVVQVGEQ